VKTRFRSHLGWGWLLVAGGLLVAGRLAWMAAWSVQVGLYVPGSRWLVLIPAALAGPILLGSLRLAWLGTGQELVVGRREVTYRHHGRRLSDRWERVVVSATPLRIRLTNGTWMACVDRCFFPDFPRLLKLVSEVHDAARQREQQVLVR